MFVGVCMCLTLAICINGSIEKDMEDWEDEE